MRYLALRIFDLNALIQDIRVIAYGHVRASTHAIRVYPYVPRGIQCNYYRGVFDRIFRTRLSKADFIHIPAGKIALMIRCAVTNKTLYFAWLLREYSTFFHTHLLHLAKDKRNQLLLWKCFSRCNCNETRIFLYPCDFFHLRHYSTVRLSNDTTLLHD